MTHLYTKYHLNPCNHQWENEQKLSLLWVWLTMHGRTEIIRPVFNGRIRIARATINKQTDHYIEKDSWPLQSLVSKIPEMPLVCIFRIYFFLEWVRNTSSQI
jgi:hypothetical protein